MTRKIALMLPVVVAYAFCLWLMVGTAEPAVIDPIRMLSPRYHGADALTVGWKGEITAYKWTGKTYRVMWVRGSNG